MLPWFRDGQFPLYLAPMAGFTDVGFRALCKAQGADVMVAEFVLADAILHDAEKAWQRVDFTPEQRPMGVQLFGSGPVEMAEAARVLVDRLQPDFVDLNFGCPADRVTCRDAGSSLLRDVPKLARIARAVVDACPGVPVTGKIRLGWDETCIVAHEAARALEEAGAQAVAIHGRTKVQGYKGEADWDTIAEVAEAVTIPVIGNGSVRSLERIVQVREGTRIHGVMIGRAALGYPWIFRELKLLLAAHKRGEWLSVRDLPAVSVAERWQVLRDYAHALVAESLRRHGNDHLSRHRAKLKSLTKGMPAGAKIRNLLDHTDHLADLDALAEAHLTTAADLPTKPLAIGLGGTLDALARHQ